MAARYDAHDLGDLHVEYPHQTTVEVPGVTFADAHRAMADLGQHRSTQVTAHDGTLYLLTGLTAVAATWTPDRRVVA